MPLRPPYFTLSTRPFNDTPVAGVRSSVSNQNDNACSASLPIVRRSGLRNSNSLLPDLERRRPKQSRPKVESRLWSVSNVLFWWRMNPPPQCVLIHPTRCLNRSPVWSRLIADILRIHPLRLSAAPNSTCVVATGSVCWAAMARASQRSCAPWSGSWIRSQAIAPMRGLSGLATSHNGKSRPLTRNQVRLNT